IPLSVRTCRLRNLPPMILISVALLWPLCADAPLLPPLLRQNSHNPCECIESKGMRSWSIPMGRFFGAEFRLHFTFVILLIYVVVSESSPSTSAIPRASVLAALIVLAVLVHELAHLLVARYAGLAPRAVVLLPIGGINLAIESEGNDQTPRWQREIRVALAGPMVNLAIAMMTGAVLAATSPELPLLQHPFVSAAGLPRAIFWINLALGAFNLLPTY